MSTLSEKTILRATCLAARRAMPPEARAVADAALIAAAVSALTHPPAGPIKEGPVCAYSPMTGEPGEPDLLSALAAAVGTVLLPVLTRDRDLDWAAYEGPDLLAHTGLLRHPPGTLLGPDAIATAHAILVPAVAVDHSGTRLGRGGGSYDRALGRVASDTPVLALLYDDELVDCVPAEPHDRPVSAVITPSDGLRWLSH